MWHLQIVTAWQSQFWVPSRCPSALCLSGLALNSITNEPPLVPWSQKHCSLGSDYIRPVGPDHNVTGAQTPGSPSASNVFRGQSGHWQFHTQHCCLFWNLLPLLQRQHGYIAWYCMMLPKVQRKQLYSLRKTTDLNLRGLKRFLTV